MLRSVEFFIAFFSLTDRALFEKKKKEVAKLPTPKNPTEVRHLGAKAIVSLTPDKTNSGRNIQSFSTICQGLYEKLIRANDDTVKVMRVLGDALEREADIYKELTVAYASIDVLLYR